MVFRELAVAVLEARAGLSRWTGIVRGPRGHFTHVVPWRPPHWREAAEQPNGMGTTAAARMEQASVGFRHLQRAIGLPTAATHLRKELNER